MSAFHLLLTENKNPAFVKGADATYLGFHRWVLIGYAVFGRTFAYIGIAPIFIGEVLLLSGILLTRPFATIGRLLALPQFYFLLFFLALCAARAITDIPTYGMLTLRDAAIWGYGIFAIIIASLLIRIPQTLPQVLISYSKFIPFYLIVGPIMGIFSTFYGLSLPDVPWGHASPLAVKTNDVMVHMAGMFVFLYLGMKRPVAWMFPIIFLSVLILGTINRGGFLAFSVVVIFVIIMRPKLRFIASMIGASIVSLSLLSFVDIDYQVFGRHISTSQLATNVVSIFSSSGSSDLGSTREWRIDWWKDIINYTVHGDYFWSGKGYGINLANVDGYQVDVDGESLRSPHNSHMTFLARGGVPTFIAWIILQLSWAIGMISVIFKARKLKLVNWENLAIFQLAYWIAIMIAANFDVYLEGPVGGIWFWTIFGSGLATQWLSRYQVESLGQIGARGPFIPNSKLASQPTA